MSENVFQSVWPGLASYTEDDQLRFFGRDREIEELLDSISAEPLCIVYGPSGVGKTSLLQAGVFPQLRAKGYIPVRIRLDHSSGARPYAEQVDEALRKAAQAARLTVQEICSRSTGKRPETMWEWSHRHVFVNALKREVEPVLLFDQFEEAFTLCDAGDGQVEKLMDELSDLCANDVPEVVANDLAQGGLELTFPSDRQPWRVIINIREDFLPRLEEWSSTRPVFRQKRISISALDTDQAFEAVSRPGAGILSADVAHAIVDSVKGASSRVDPALLSLFCARLDFLRQEARRAEISALLVEEHKRNILVNFYNEAMGGVSGETKKYLETHLLNSRGFRILLQVAEAEHDGVSRDDLEKLVNIRLLHVISRDGEQWVEFSHDILSKAARQAREQREKNRQRTQVRRLKRVIWGLGSLLLFLGLGIAAFFWDANRVVTNYYANYVDSFGLPEGIFPLKESDTAHRHIHYRFEYKGFQRGKSPHTDSADWCVWNMFGFRRRLVRVIQANSRGYPCKWNHTEYSDRPQIQDFAYEESACCLREIRCGRFNGEGRDPYLERRIELWNDGGVTNTLVKFFIGENVLGFAYGTGAEKVIDSSDGKSLGKNDITQHLVQYDANGRVTRRLFLNLYGNNVPNGDGLYGFSYEYDDLGRQKAQWYLFRDGDGFSRRANKAGVAGRRYEYVGRNMRKVEYVDTEGRPTSGPNGWMVCADSFDEFDNNTESWYFDAKGNKSICTDGYAGCRAEYDAFGNLVRLEFLATDGKPTLHKNGYAEVRLEYDVRGNMTKMAYLGVDGKPTLLKDGYAEMHMEYDSRGNRTRESYFGEDGNLTLLKDGYAEKRMEYDVRGNMTKQLYFGVDGKPTLHKDGYAEIRMEYNARGNRIRESCFGPDGKPTLLKDGYAEKRMEYDVRGNITKQSYFGVDGGPTLHRDGYAGWLAEYDERGRKTRNVWIGVDGKPTLTEDGCAEYRNEYDGFGNITELLCLDVAGKPILCKYGYAACRNAYDARGNRTRESYFGVDGRPTLNSEGLAERRMEYDACGNMTKKSYFGVDGKPTLLKDCYAEVNVEYDTRGNMTKVSCFGINGEPKLSWITEYDARGNKMRESYFVGGKPTLLMGYAERSMEYDALGNRIRESYFGVDGKPTLLKDGYAEVRYTYKQDGTVATAEFFDVSGNKITLRQVVVSVEVTPNLAAEKAGVKKGDVWCRLGTYDILKSENVYEVAAAMQVVRNAEKELVVARKVGDAYEIHSFKFPVGIMGIRVNEQNIPDFDKLAQAYKAYCEKEKQEGEKPLPKKI